MPDTVDITVQESPVSVTVSETPQSVSVTAAETPQTVSVAASETPQAVAVDVEQAAAQPVQVAVAEAPAGPPGANAQIQVLTLAAYMALTPEQQMNGTWYVIPKA